jgi:tetratricopeptide (TPR) repeat protein
MADRDNEFFAAEDRAHEDRAQALNAEGLALARSGDYAGAVKLFGKAVSASPSYVAGFFNRGQMYMHIGDLDSATLDFRQVLELDPQNDAARQQLAEVRSLEKPHGACEGCGSEDLQAKTVRVWPSKQTPAGPKPGGKLNWLDYAVVPLAALMVIQAILTLSLGYSLGAESQVISFGWVWLAVIVALSAWEFVRLGRTGRRTEQSCKNCGAKWWAEPPPV